jgi:hypothetical protein
MTDSGKGFLYLEKKSLQFTDTVGSRFSDPGIRHHVTQAKVKKRRPHLASEGYKLTNVN